MKPRSVRIAAAALTAAAVGLALPASGATDPACASAPREGWVAVHPPLQPRLLTVSSDDSLVLVSDGRGLVASTDRGCTWLPAHFPGADVPGAELVLRGLAVLMPQRHLTHVLLLGAERLPTGVTRPRAWVSTDAARTFTDISTGLPFIGEPLQLASAPIGGMAYALIAPAAPGQGSRLLGWAPGSFAWQDAMQPTSTTVLDGIAPDPRSWTDLWAWGEGGLFFSGAQGVNLQRVPSVTGHISVVDVGPSPTTPTSRTRAFLADGTSVWSDDATTHYFAPTHQAEGGVVTAVASLPTVAGAYATVANGRLRLTPGWGRRAVDVTPARTAVRRVAMSLGSVPRLWSLTDSGLLRRDLIITSRGSGSEVLSRLTGGSLVTTAPAITAALTPPRLRVSLPAGSARQVPYELAVPSARRPVDVFFLADTTNSMQPVLRGLRDDLNGVVGQLESAGVDARFGVADFRDYDVPGVTTSPCPKRTGNTSVSTSSDNYAYRLVRRVAPPDDDLRLAIASLRTGGGTCDGSDSALEAVNQAITGSGRAVAGAGLGSATQQLPAGQEAGFRPDALRIIILATDVAWREPTTGYPGPASSLVFALARKAKVRVAGIAVGDSERAPANGLVGGSGPDLRRIAVATGAKAPPGGVDCDSDGSADISAGAPLVCSLRLAQGRATRVGDAVVQLVHGLVPPLTMRFRVDSPSRTVASLHGDQAVKLDLWRSHTVPTTVSVRCSQAQAGQQHRSRVIAEGDRGTLASAVIDVSCLRAAVPQRWTAAPPLVVAPIGLAVAPVVEPPAAVSNPGPVQQAQTNPGSNSALAAVDQDEPDVAMAEADDLAMQRMSVGFVLAAGLMTGTAAAVVRRRTSPALAAQRDD